MSGELFVTKVEVDGPAHFEDSMDWPPFILTAMIDEHRDWALAQYYATRVWV